MMGEVFFKKMAIIGIGLIGSSFARAARDRGLVHSITCIDRDERVCKTALEIGLCDVATQSFEEGLKGADLIILCVPVGQMGQVAARISPYIEDGAIISDAGSVKGAVIRDVSPHIPKHASFIAAHPIAGSEKSGPTAGFATLFEGRWMILCPQEDQKGGKEVKKLSDFFSAMGSKISIMSHEHHDRILGMTSHLPHLIAYTVVGTASDLGDDMKSQVIEYSAGGFRDFTRIAASDPVMWRDVFLNNKDAVLELLQRFTEDLTALQKAIRKGDGDMLHDHFTKTRAIRKAIIDAKQAE